MKTKTIIKLLAICIAFICTATQCKKEEEKPKLPPETQIGADTFGALVNGEVFLRKAQFGFLGVRAEYNQLSDILTIRASGNIFGKTERSVSLFLTVLNPKENEKRKFMSFEYWEGDSRITVHNTGEFVLTKLEITDNQFSPAYAIVCGTFACDVSPSIKITQGRFDIGRLAITGR